MKLEKVILSEVTQTLEHKCHIVMVKHKMLQVPEWWQWAAGMRPQWATKAVRSQAGSLGVGEKQRCSMQRKWVFI